MQNNLEWIVFDLGGVVVNLDIEGVQEELARRSATDRTVIESFTRTRDASGLSPDEKLHRGLLEIEEYVSLMNQVLTRRLKPEEMIDLRLQVIQGEDEEVLEIIRALSLSRKVACFSNTHAIHWNHMLANYRSLRLFHRRIASHLIRAAKPEPEAFAIVSRELNATPAGCLLIDDALVNVEAARAFGWHAIHFRTAAGLRADLQTYGITV